ICNGYNAQTFECYFVVIFMPLCVDICATTLYNIVTGKRYTTKTQEVNTMTYKGYTIDRDNLGRLYIHNNSDPGKKALIERMESRHGIHTIEAAAEHGLGSREYEIVEI